MMRFALFAAVLLAACSQEPVVSGGPTGTFAGEGRNRLCIAADGPAQRAGVIIYGPEDHNCTASGRVEQTAGGLILVPRGEGECRIPLVVEGSTARIGPVPAACAYYCGPNARFESAQFARLETAETVTDLAGDPLC